MMNEFSRTRMLLGGDGMEKLKAEATYITDTVLEDGLFNALRHFELI